MKENDFEKCLDNMIIEGLIKEAEQDNADFAAAMRAMSEEDLMDIIMEPVYVMDDDLRLSFSEDSCLAAEPEICSNANYRPPIKACSTFRIADGFAVDDPHTGARVDDDFDLEWDEEGSGHSQRKQRRGRKLLPWIVSAISAAAIILLVLIPSLNSMNAKLCDSALYLSESYITRAKGGFDVASASTEEIKAVLPELRKQFEATISSKGLVNEDFEDAGWTLTIAYLRLHKKGDAVKVLKTLAEHTGDDTPFGRHCRLLLRQLE